VTGTTVRIGPPLTTVGERLSAEDIRRSILDPNAVIAEGFQAGLMLQDFGEKLSPEELDQIVGYLSGEVGLAERLAHPGVHLLALILLFNLGITWAIRATGAAGETEPAEGQTLINVLAWSRWGGILVVIPLAAVLYVWEPSVAPEPPTRTAAPQVEVSEPETGVEAVATTPGETLFRVTCPACHGSDAKGVPGLGKDMTTSEFIASQSDAELVDFIKRGRPAGDPLNTTGVAMPAKGANVTLTDPEIQLIVEYIRSLRN
jgi:disulfide bond formation protein DsbB